MHSRTGLAIVPRRLDPTDEYRCNGCNTPTARNMLTVKKVLFTGMGAGAQTDRARVVAWLCPSCVKRDSDWNRPPYVQPTERVARSENIG
jgi:hypothetical protein